MPTSKASYEDKKDPEPESLENGARHREVPMNLSDS